jgi:hypothetical protein
MDWSLIAIVIVAAGAAYIGGRWGETGRIHAITASIAEVFTQEREKAFAHESGRQEAVLANLDKLEAQVGAVTTTQEEIKADINSAVWLRQNVWNLKRDVYIRLLEALGDLFSEADHAAHLYRQEERRQKAGRPPSPLDIERAKELGDKMRDTKRLVAQNLSIAGMVVHCDSIRIVQEGLAQWSKADSLSNSADYEGLRGGVERIMERLQVSASLDLRNARSA